ncbi:type II toxin-antitoxin system Y4mF family antitoxin [uncultured Algoriphagus sp.]|uniref:type II toxin-antitoxin system Y4mF family antitoxin n=1 Tax=uncultured Algoriphagus sp. TaxID=417365 RepID=UPI0030EDDF1B|tara:strand:- start:20633 stop:20848 length:216 start_codon:yes stop_codon:yes gene_type:complete
MNHIAEFVKTRRKQLGMTQEEFAEKAGVALTVIRKIEQGKENLNLSKVNHVLTMFGHILAPISEKDNKLVK